MNTVTDFMQRARIIGPKNEKTATEAIFVRMCDISGALWFDNLSCIFMSKSKHTLV